MPKKIAETKCTCQACGNIWYYGKRDVMDERLEKTCSCCCCGCVPDIFFWKKELRHLNKCPKCRSSVIKKEEVIHEVE